jgi:peptide chain release factor 1
MVSDADTPRATDAELGSLLAAAEPELSERAALMAALADPATHADPVTARRVGTRFAVLDRLAAAATEVRAAGADLQATRELAAEDPGFATEIDPAARRRDAAVATLRRLLIPRDPDDDRDVLLEIRAGEGGAESALFAADLLRMYTRYAERRGWKTEILDDAPADLGGVKSVTLAVKAGSGHTGEPDSAPFARLKFEGGVHRVQRVPVTESAGRVHTSAAGVLVLPEAADVEVTIDPNDLRIDVFRSSGPGGQSVNTTDSAVRITHLPTGIVVSCQNEKSQLQNREQALRILRARLLAAAREAADAAASAQRRSQVRTVDRSERIRTYNFAENRIADHRVGYKAYNLDSVLDGDLDAVIGACLDADDEARLAAGPA